MKKKIENLKITMLKKISNFAKESLVFTLQIDIFWRIENILVYCKIKHVLSMPVEVDSLICSQVMIAVIFENAVTRKMRLKFNYWFFFLFFFMNTFRIWL